MFESLGEKLSNAFKKFKNKGKLTEADVKAGMREVKLAFIYAFLKRSASVLNVWV